jgi:hypothetical protein
MTANDTRTEEVIVSGRGLERTSYIANDNFQIDFGKKIIQCNSFQACFISKTIHRLLCSDNTVAKFEVGLREYSSDVCEEVSRFIKSGCIEINESNCKDLKFVFGVLDNDEILNRLIEFELGKELSNSNCIRRLKQKEESKCKFGDELEFIASRFYEFESSELEVLRGFSVEILAKVLSSENLCLKDEDSFVEFISSLGEEYASLYDYVEFRFLSVKGIDQFLGSFSLEGMNERVWDSICRRLRYQISGLTLNEERFGSQRFEYTEGNEWNGIIHHLSKKCDGNVHLKGVVNITASGKDERNKCYDVTRHGWNDYWISRKDSKWSSDLWISFGFKDVRVSLQHYTLKSSGHGSCYFTQWEIEGSNDGSTWKSVDSRNTKDLCGNYIVKTYECSTSDPSEFFRFIRMRQTERDSPGHNAPLMLSEIELFGRLRYSL